MGFFGQLFQRRKEVAPPSKSSKNKLNCDKPKSLRKEISEFVKTFCEHTDPDTLRVMKETTRDLIDSNIAEQSLKVHDVVPDFELPDSNGAMVKSAELISQSSYTVIIFYRGNWCTYGRKCCVCVLFGVCFVSLLMLYLTVAELLYSVLAQLRPPLIILC